MFGEIHVNGYERAKGLKPTLFVGLGTMGTRAVKRAKALFKALYGVVPHHVQFLAFDTREQETWLNEEGGKLEGNEFICLGGFDTGELRKSLRKDSENPINQWYPLEELPAIVVLQGAAGVRPVGRLSYWYHRDSQSLQDIVKAKLRALKDAKLPELAREQGFDVTLKHGIDIHIACSVCGGTGSAILLDLAYDLKWWARPVITEVIAHLILPEAFSDLGIMNTVLRSNAYTTLCEIEHFTQNGGWKAEHRDEVVELDAPPFSYCYLLNGTRKPGTGNLDVDRLVEKIGLAMVYLSMTPDGQQAGANIIGLKPALLLKERTKGQMCAYSTYGISVLELASPSVRQEAASHLAESVLTEFLQSGSYDDSRIDTEIDEFLNQADISGPALSPPTFHLDPSDLEPLLSADKHTLRQEGHRWFKIAYENALAPFNEANEYYAQRKRGMSEFVENWMLERLGRDGRGLAYFIAFYERLRDRAIKEQQRLTDVAKSYQDAADREHAQARRRLDNAIQKGNSNQLRDALPAFERAEGNRRVSLFFYAVADTYGELVNQAEKFRHQCESVTELLGGFHVEISVSPDSHPAILGRKSFWDARTFVSEFFRRRPELRRKLISEIAKEAASLQLEERDKFREILLSQCQASIDQIQVTLSGEAAKAEAKVLEMVADAEPSCAISTSYPVNNLEPVDVSSVRRNTPVYHLLTNALPLLSPTDTSQAGEQEIRLLRTLHGLALWSIEEFKTYRLSFEERLKSSKERQGEDMWLNRSWRVQQLEP